MIDDRGRADGPGTGRRDSPGSPLHSPDRPGEGARGPSDQRPPEDALLPLVYDELRALARRLFRRERAGHTLEPTALVHEVFLRLAEQEKVEWNGRTHVFAVGARMMRRVLVDHARRRLRRKRGAGDERVTFDEALAADGRSALSLAEVIAVHDALAELARLDPRQASIVEQRYFGGLTAAEIARELGIASRTVEAELTHARAFLRRRLAETQQP